MLLGGISFNRFNSQAIDGNQMVKHQENDSVLGAAGYR